MEVHHSHGVTHKKKWTEYLLEFLMLFLAVFLGFTAENIREHNIERHREKEYMLNILQDLNRDTVTLSNEIRLRKMREPVTDSLMKELDSIGIYTNLQNLYMHAYKLTSIRTFTYSNSTVNQLKSSGNLRLVKKAQIADSVIMYDLAVETYLLRERIEPDIISDYRKAITLVLDGEVILEMSRITDAAGNYINPTIAKPLLTKDPVFINQVKSFAAILYYRNRSNIFRLERLKITAINLIQLIKKEYDL